MTAQAMSEPAGERTLSVDAGCDRVRGTGERDEERVSLCVDLDAVVTLEARAQ